MGWAGGGICPRGRGQEGGTPPAQWSSRPTPSSCSTRKATWRPGPGRRRRKRTARERPRRTRRRWRRRGPSRPPGRASARPSPEVGVSAGSLPACGPGCPPARSHPLCSVPAGGRAGAGSPGGTPKKSKVEPYSLTAQQSSLIKEDQSNTKLWSEILKSLKDGTVSACHPHPYLAWTSSPLVIVYG